MLFETKSPPLANVSIPGPLAHIVKIHIMTIFKNPQHRKLILYFPLIIIISLTAGCEGLQDLYIINCSDDAAIVIIKPGKHFRQQSINNYKKKYTDQHFEPTDSIISKYQVEYYQSEFNNAESYFLVNGDSLIVELKSGESLRFALTMWIVSPGNIREPSLNIDKLTIISKSDTYIARNRKEILQLQKDKRFKYDNYYKDKVGPKSREHRKILIK